MLPISLKNTVMWRKHLVNLVANVTHFEFFFNVHNFSKCVVTMHTYINQTRIWPKASSKIVILSWFMTYAIIPKTRQSEYYILYSTSYSYFQTLLYGERYPCDVGKLPENIQKKQIQDNFPMFVYITKRYSA